MLLTSGSSGGRDVIFRLMAVTDPAAKGVMNRFGADLADTQKRLTQNMAGEAKKQADTVRKEHTKAALDVSKVYQRAEMDDFKFKQKLRQQSIEQEKKAETELAQWRSRLRANSVVLEFKENQRLAQEKKRDDSRTAQETARDTARAQREATQHHRQTIRNEKRRERGFEGLVGGLGNIARGAAYSGLVGEENTQTILNTLLGVEGVQSMYRGATGAAKGASTVTGLAIGAGGAAGGGIAAMAALVAWLPALASAVKGAMVVIRGSSSTHRGDIMGGLGEGVASTYASLAGAVPGSVRRSDFGKGFLSTFGFGMLSPYAEAANASEDVTAQQKLAMQRQGLMGQLTGNISSLGHARRESAAGSVTASQQALRGDISLFNQLRAGGENNEAVQAAYQNVKASMEQIKQLSLDAARAQVEGSRDQLENLRASHSEAKQLADEAMRAYRGDISKAGSLDPEGIVKLREISRKQKAGADLNAGDIGFAGQFDVFKDYVSSQQERRAKAFGVDDIFESERQRAKDTARRQAELAEQIVKTELTIKQQHEIVIRLEGPGFADEIVKGIDEALPEKLRAFQAQMERVIQEKIIGAQTQLRNLTRAQ